MNRDSVGRVAQLMGGGVGLKPEFRDHDHTGWAAYWD